MNNHHSFNDVPKQPANQYEETPNHNRAARRNSLGELATAAYNSFSSFFRSTATEEIKQPASWDRQRTSHELGSFVTNRLAALETITLED